MSDDWSIGTRVGRWSGFGPYYAMFPVNFAREFICRYSAPGDVVLDPFCGRGTTNYVAKALDRESVGYEVNPVGWIYASTKSDPAKNLRHVLRRVEEIYELCTDCDREPENEFQSWAYCNEVLAFINSCRKNLKWRSSKIDRTIAAFLLVYLHGKLGGSLSNQMRQSKSMAPRYAIEWWKKRGMHPPEIDPVEYISRRIMWRYSKGLWQTNVNARIYLGDCTTLLRRYRGTGAQLVLTSPPYKGVTNYKYDNWIRLWALGGRALPSGTHEGRHGNGEEYAKMLESTFRSVRANCTDNAAVVVRTDFREFTLRTTAETLHRHWPNYTLYGRHTKAPKPTQTTLFGDHSAKPGEVDLLALPDFKSAPAGFHSLTE